MKKPRNKILGFLPKVLSFHYPPPFCSSRDKDASVPRNRARFPVTIIPREVRRTPNMPLEPTSPKVSCLGQIKQQRHGRKNKNKLINKEEDARWRSRPLPSKESKGKEEERMPVDGNAPALGKMRRFASRRRSSLSNFDWKAQVAPEEEEEDRTALSAPPVGEVGVGLMPKKEINLRKRRTMPLDMGPPRSDS